MSWTEMFRVMGRSPDLYRRRHSGRSPRSTVHKTTEFKKDEIDGCMEALHLCEAVDLVQVVEDARRGVRIDRDRQSGKGKPTVIRVDRGTLIPPGDRGVTAVDAGDVKASRKARYYGGRSTPRPIRLVRHAGHGSWNETAWSALSRSRRWIEQRRTVRHAAGDHGDT